MPGPGKCGNCRLPGHNRRTCPNAAAADETPELTALQAAAAAAAETEYSKNLKTKELYVEAFADLGEPPDDVIKRCEWIQGIAGKALLLTLQGNGNRELNQEIRVMASTIRNLIPAERLAELEEKLKARAKPRKPQRRRRGPKPEPVTTTPESPPRVRG